MVTSEDGSDEVTTADGEQETSIHMQTDLTKINKSIVLPVSKEQIIYGVDHLGFVSLIDYIFICLHVRK